MTQPTGHPFPATGPGFAFPLSQRPRTFKHGTQTEYAAHRTRFGSSTPEPPRWDDDISSISGDTDTCFGDSEDGSDRDQALEPLQLPAPFWPSRGSKQTKAAIAKELQEGVIQQLPLSANTRLPDFRRMTRQDVELRVKELWGYPGKSVQVDTILEVGCRQRSIIFVAKTGIGKSLIFETIPLLDPNHPGIALIIMPLKHIQQQQLEKVNRLPGARAVVYDGEHHSELLRYQIAAGHFTHVFIGPEMILTKDFHNDVIKSESFRGRLRVFAIDEIHCVDDWKDFRPRYSELGVLRARLPSVPYLGVTATLTPRMEDYIKKSSGFDYSCPVLRTSVDRPEISLSVIFAEGKLGTFEDLRRFFPLGDIQAAKDIPKMVIYFDSIRLLLAFIDIVRLRWFSEFGYPVGSDEWIQPYFAAMADSDKQRVSDEFEKPDNPLEPGAWSKYRIVVASEGYGLGADNPDIVIIVNFRLPKTINALAQRAGRAMRSGSGQAHFFLITEPWAYDGQRLIARKRKQKNPSASQLRLDTLHDTSSESEAGSQPESSLLNSQEKRDAERRLKLTDDIRSFIHTKECHRLALLGCFGDNTYTGRLQERPAICCSTCNPEIIPSFRPNPSVSVMKSVFEGWLSERLSKWRDDEVAKVTAGSDIPVLGDLVLPDPVLKQLALFQPGFQSEDLDRIGRVWSALPIYRTEIERIIGELSSLPFLEVQKRRKTTKLGKEYALAMAENDTSNEARVYDESRTSWLIVVGRRDLISKEKPSRRKKAETGGLAPVTMNLRQQSIAVQPNSSPNSSFNSSFDSSFNSPSTPASSNTGSQLSLASQLELQGAPIPTFRSPLATLDPNCIQGRGRK